MPTGVLDEVTKKVFKQKVLAQLSAEPFLDMSSRFPPGAVEEPSNSQIMEKLESLEQYLKLVIGDHVLINGQFKNIKC